MGKAKKLEELEESLGAGIINKEEYEKQKKRIEEEKEEQGKAEEEIVEEEKSLMGDKVLVFLILGLILVFVLFFFWRTFTQEQPQTIDGMHILNLKGKLKEEKGYVYDGVHSFIRLDDLWYVQLKSPGGTRIYDMALRYGPRDLEDIEIKGFLDVDLFNDAQDYYVTYNPVGNDFSHVALAVGDFNQHMTNVFFKTPIAACDRNETEACGIRPIINCENTGKVVLYVKEAEKLNVFYDNNCIVVEGQDLDLVKGVDRILLNLYGIMKQ